MLKVTGIRRYEDSHRTNAKNVKVLVFVDFETIEENISRRLVTGPREAGAPIKPRALKQNASLQRAFKKLGLTIDTISWNNYAGCGMCPCSPGYVVKCKEAFGWMEEGHRSQWSTPIYALWLKEQK